MPGIRSVQANQSGSAIFAILAAAAVATALLGACTTQRASMPEVARPAVTVNAATVGLARVRDARPNSEVGRLGVGGAITMTSGTELTTYISDYATSQLAARGFNAIPAVDPTDPATGANRFKGSTVLFTLQAINVTMTDTLLTPGRATADILGQVYDAEGKQTFSSQVAGYYSESFPVFSGPETTSQMTGKIAAEACNRAVLAIILDPKFVSALRATSPAVPAKQSAAR